MLSINERIKHLAAFGHVNQDVKTDKWALEFMKMI